MAELGLVAGQVGRLDSAGAERAGEAMRFAALTLSAPAAVCYVALMSSGADQTIGVATLAVVGVLYGLLCLLHYETAFYVLVLFVPLQFRWVETRFGYLSVTDMLIATLAVFWAMRRLTGATTVQRNGSAVWLILWLAAAGMAVVPSIDRGTAVRQLVRLLTCGVVFGLTVDQVRDRAALMRTARMLVWSSLFVSAYGFYEYFYLKRDMPLLLEGAINTTKRIVTVFDQSNITAGYLVMIAALVMLLLIESRRPAAKVFYAAIFALNTAAVGLTFSRAGWLCLLLVLLILPLKTYARMLLVAALVGAVAGSNLAYNVTSRQRSIDERLSIYQRSWVYIKARPLLGYGPGTVAHLALSQQETAAGNVVVRNAHNLYLTAALETGVCGLGLFLAFLASLLGRAVGLGRRLRRGGPKQRRGWLAVRCVAVSMAAILLTRLFQTGMLYVGMWVIFGLVGALPAVFGGPATAAGGAGVHEGCGRS